MNENTGSILIFLLKQKKTKLNKFLINLKCIENLSRNLLISQLGFSLIINHFPFFILKLALNCKKEIS